MTGWFSAEDALCWCGVAAFCILGLGAVPAQTAMGGVEAIQVDDNSGWATALPDGRLMMWWTEGKHQDDPEAISDPEIVQQAFARYSSDNGYTWSELELLFDFPKTEGIYLGDNSGPTLCDADGVIHLFGLHFFYFDKEE